MIETSTIQFFQPSNKSSQHINQQHNQQIIISDLIHFHLVTKISIFHLTAIFHTQSDFFLFLPWFPPFFIFAAFLDSLSICYWTDTFAFFCLVSSSGILILLAFFGRPVFCSAIYGGQYLHDGFAVWLVVRVLMLMFAQICPCGYWLRHFFVDHQLGMEFVAVRPSTLELFTTAIKWWHNTGLHSPLEIHRYSHQRQNP